MEKTKDTKYKEKFVTLYTDACRKEDGLMAYAFWARHDDGRIRNAAMCPPDLETICQGEMYAICQGMYKVLKNLPDTKGFYVTSDSMGAINTLKNTYRETTAKGKERREHTKRLKLAFDKMVEKHGLEVDFRHIKAHTGRTANTRVWLNDWCDKILNTVIKKTQR